MASDIKWRIVELLSKGDTTPTEIAGKLKKSLPNICLHLKGLEDLNLIKRIGEKSGKTRPHTKYTIGTGFIRLTQAVPGSARKIFLELDENLKTHLNLWSIPQKEFHYYLERLWWDMQNYIESIEAVAVFGSVAKGNARPESDIDVLILAKKNIKKLEKKFSARIIGPSRMGKMIMAHVFTVKDFKDMLGSGSVFAKEILPNMIIIYDSSRVLERMMQNGPERQAG